METVKHPKKIWPLLLGGLVLVFLFAFAVKILLSANPPAAEEDAARAAERSKALEELRAENAVKLGTYAWVDKAKGQVQMPIAQATELAMARMNSRPPAPAGPITPPAPTPEAAPPAPEAQPSASPAVPPAAVN
jgi:hypothetical protein